MTINSLINPLTSGEQLKAPWAFCIGLYSKNLSKSSGEPLTWMHWSYAWNILRTGGFKFVQMKSLWSCMAPLKGH